MEFIITTIILILLTIVLKFIFNYNIKKLKIEIDKEMPSTGKPCRVYGF